MKKVRLKTDWVNGALCYKKDTILELRNKCYCNLRIKPVSFHALPEEIIKNNPDIFEMIEEKNIEEQKIIKT